MSQSGPPTDPPDPYGQPNPYGEPTPYGQSDPASPDAAPGPPDPSGPAEPITTGSGGYNPYPDTWNDPAAPAQPPRYGQPSPYAGVPQPGAPTANPYAGTASPDKETFGFGGYASWLSRVGAYLIDALAGTVAALPIYIGYFVLFSDATTTTDVNGVKQLHLHPSAFSTLMIVIGALTSIAFWIWNYCIRQGRTGATVGKSVLALRVVNSDLQPIGAGLSFLRQLVHIVDSFCLLGYLWPIWDSKRQTFADKIMGTVVISATTPQPRVY